MKQLSALYDYTDRHNIDVDFYLMSKAESLSAPLYDGTCVIAIDPSRLEGSRDELVKLAHELGHCETGSFYCRHTPFDERNRNEERANRWAIKKLLPFEEMRAAMRKGYTEVYELAEYFEVTEDFVRQAIEYYTGACGLRFHDGSHEE